MVGKPKFEVDDRVKFMLDDEYIEGKVYIVDRWGTFWDDSDVSYDIMDEQHNILYKHISERHVEAVN